MGNAKLWFGPQPSPRQSAVRSDEQKQSSFQDRKERKPQNKVSSL